MDYFDVAATGHRPLKLGGYQYSPIQDAIRRDMRSYIVEHPNIRGISGMALGVDQWWAEELIHMGRPFIAALPFVGQGDRWPSESQRHHNFLLDHAEKLVIVSDGAYTAWKMQVRNRWMVDNCRELVAVFDGSPGGTANCISYAEQVGRSIHYIRPRR